MKFDCEVKVVDMLMGSGKTSAAINYMNAASPKEKFLYITPYLDEVERIRAKCPRRKFNTPKPMGTKLNSIKHLLEKGSNIVSTHALFRRFDNEAIDLCRIRNYTLIMDEVTDVIEKYEISQNDFRTLREKYIDIDEETGMIRWRESENDYKGKFDKEKRLCEMGCLAYYGGSVMMWLFPVEAFNAFKKVYILTYMFRAQIQRYYYDYYNLPYSYVYVTGNSVENYQFCEEASVASKMEYNFSNLIHILEDKKLNQIGAREYDLSKNWYIRNSGNAVMRKLKNNIYNYFFNRRNTKSSENLWTTFKDFKKPLSGKGYGRAFVPLNMRASNKYRDRISVAYPVNRYLDTSIKHFFMQHDVEVDEDGFALSEMLQFIWRSAIRDGKEIWIYVPSARMRNLLKNWIAENDCAKTRAESSDETNK